MENQLIKEIVLLIVRWLLKVGAGVIGALGVSNGAVEEILIAVLMFVAGLIISLFQRSKDKAEVPK